MRRLLTTGIKAILAIAVLTTAAHWAFRVQREPAPTSAMAAIPDPVTTGSIAPRKIERAVPAPMPAVSDAAMPGLDQQHLLQLMSGVADRAKPATAAKPAAANSSAAKSSAAKPVAKKPSPVKQADAKPVTVKQADAKPAKSLVAAR